MAEQKVELSMSIKGPRETVCITKEMSADEARSALAAVCRVTGWPPAVKADSVVRP